MILLVRLRIRGRCEARLGVKMVVEDRMAGTRWRVWMKPLGLRVGVVGGGEI